NYPPTFQTLLVPFSFAPYAMAFAAWSLLLLGGHVFVTRHFASRSLLWPLLLFPGAILNLLGANGLVVAALLGGGFLLLDRRPALAGVLFGLATFKPHLAWLVPFALFAGRRHRALVALLVTAAALFALSLLVCGSSAWSAFLARATHSTPVAASGSADWERVPTLYTLLQVLGFGKMLAGIVHGLVAIVAVVTTLRLWRVEAKPLVRSAALVLALLVATPYARMYDFALLLVPIVALAEEMERRPRRSDRLLLSVAWIAPLVGFVVSASTAWLSLVPIALLVRLVRADRNSDSPAPEPAAA
ncbi:MAG TPA: glycosyltransferase family 87 protein, partial [Polyangiaceae bacterium]